MEKMNYPKTIFCDIDGTIFIHSSLSKMKLGEHHNYDILPGVVEAFDEWNKNGYKIILTTGRTESLRDFTIKQLSHAGIFYDQLVMGLPRGERVIINDTKPDGTKTAKAIQIQRDSGLNNVKI